MRNKLHFHKESLLLGSSSSSFLRGLFKGGLGLHAREKVEFGMGIANALDHALSGEVLDESTSNGSADLELIAKHSAGDAEDLGNFLGNLIESLLFEEHVVVELILYLDLGPTLLFSLRSF